MSKTAPPPNPLLRLLNPRIVVYLLLTLLLAWLMRRHVEVIRAQEKAQDAQTAPSSPHFPIRDAELASGEATPRPMLLLLAGPGDDLGKLQSRLQEEFKQKYAVILLNSRDSLDCQSFFNVEQTPCALLFDEHNNESGRLPEYIDYEHIKQWLHTLGK
ncbi:MAG: hypothetical protein PHG44_08300 [Lentisphaeria bacterium]|jgi:hypothetical protein|nr:hypothetical protein [Lentisphaeria bacterium]MDY0177058.1 hypothetical protein [Lentisphaeria bacterium]NLZ59912.1 hypothetical protein [Lentisphaerota bacterium]